jgi:hypothetical protein
MTWVKIVGVSGGHQATVDPLTENGQKLIALARRRGAGVIPDPGRDLRESCPGCACRGRDAPAGPAGGPRIA